MFERLTKKFDSMTSLEDALYVYNNQSDKVQKGFLDLFLVLGKNNVSEVKFSDRFEITRVDIKGNFEVTRVKIWFDIIVIR